MSFGFSATNNNNQILFSDSSYVLEFIGKATLRTDLGYKGFSGYYDSSVPSSWRYYWIGSFELKDFPLWYHIGYYEIEANANDMIAFSYVPVNDVFTGILYQHQITPTVTRFYVLTQNTRNINNDPFAPQVYCFKKITTKPDTGHGIKIYNSSGNETFTTQANVLIQKAGSQMNLSTSRLAPGKYSNFIYVSNNNNSHTYYIENHALVNPSASITKPAICYYCPATGVGYRGSGGINAFFELGIRFNNSLNVLQTQWGNVADLYSGYNSTKNIPAHSSFAMVIDGADYD